MAAINTRLFKAATRSDAGLLKLSAALAHQLLDRRVKLDGRSLPTWKSFIRSVSIMHVVEQARG